MRMILLALALLPLAMPATAQHRHHHGPAAAPATPTQPYAGWEARRIKALSPEQQADLLAGRGMGLALAAELNAHPGPMHVLEHAAALRMTPEQSARTEAVMAAMRAEARALGARIVALEEELDRAFATGTAEPAGVARLSTEIGTLSGRLRAAHLLAHVALRGVLTPTQVAEYDRLRGYTRP